ncbi:unnamed protein product [Onchocerca ochengi]|uniref:EF-hand domain-containing protein n=1 Tax=Onchocerca ochengi TaxID=42157 RepID=A0A182DZD3_ONCOC|nr:unnamed protein product [Onchocerca ochengi]
MLRIIALLIILAILVDFIVAFKESVSFMKHFLVKFNSFPQVLRYNSRKTEQFPTDTVISEVQQLREVLGMFDQDYKQGNVTRLTLDFQTAMKEYGDGFKSTVLQSFLKKMEDNGELKVMEKLETEWNDYNYKITCRKIFFIYRKTL